MRTIKVLGFVVALATVAAPAAAQGTLQPGAFAGIDRLARIEANRIAHRQQAQEFRGQRFRGQQFGQRAGQRFGQVGAGRRFVGARAGVRAGVGNGFRAGARAGARAGVRAGARAGFRAGERAGFRAGDRVARLQNATPQQKAFAEQFRAQRKAVHDQVLAGKLTREQAHTQMRQWVTEHRPAK